jgi:hypothetical protein
MRPRLLLAATIVCAALVVVVATSVDIDGGAGKAQASTAHAGTLASGCGTTAGAQATLAVYTSAAVRIYEGELSGSEVAADVGHVRESTQLLQALASGSRAAVQEAVHAIVYAPHWHIVRLRVLSHGQVLADVGGPYIVAPVTGTLRLHGRTLGTYVMSVQDDVGYVKLVTRFIGAPVDLYRGGVPLMGTLRPAPARAAGVSPVHVSGRAYAEQALNLKAFPSGTLQAAIFAPQPPASASCSSLTLAAWGQVARHVAARFNRQLAAHYQDLADIVHTLTGGHVFVREGSRKLVGGSRPAHIPASGTVRYAGRTWPVYSWQPSPGVRVYFLTPGAPPASTS